MSDEKTNRLISSFRDKLNNMQQRRLDEWGWSAFDAAGGSSGAIDPSARLGDPSGLAGSGGSSGGSGDMPTDESKGRKALLCDRCHGSPAHVVQENNKLFIEGNMLIGGNKKNATGRRSGTELLSECAADFQKRIREGSAVGFLGHQKDLNGNPAAASHVIQKLERRGDVFHGRARVLDEGNGKILGSILRAGGSVGFSSVMTGGLKKLGDGSQQVVPPAKLHGIDTVLLPSNGKDTHVKGLSEDTLFTIILESVASDTYHSQTLDSDDLTAKARDIIKGLGDASLLVNWDKTYGKYQQDPQRSSKTYLDHLNDDREQLIKALLKVQKDIAQQKDGDGNMRDQLASYAKLIANTSNPIRRTQLRREATELVYGERLISATVKLLSRGGSHLTENIIRPTTTHSEIETIRRRSGSRIPNLQREYEGVSRAYDSLENKAREAPERSKASNLGKRK